MSGTPEPGPVREDGTATPAPPATGGVGALLAAIGSIALLLAMGADVVAVLGRHLGLPLLGSIEIVQACVVLAASAAMLGATLARQHASVHLLTERLRPPARSTLERLAALLAAALFVALAAGSIRVSVELWSGHETSEVLGIPFRLLRLVWCASAVAIAVVFLHYAVARRPR